MEGKELLQQLTIDVTKLTEQVQASKREMTLHHKGLEGKVDGIHYDLKDHKKNFEQFKKEMWGQVNGLNKFMNENGDLPKLREVIGTNRVAHLTREAGINWLNRAWQILLGAGSLLWIIFQVIEKIQSS